MSDPEIAADAERQALLDLSRRFSREDLMRAFDVLTKAEYEIRSSMQPRYHLEMALLRWIHLRKLVPLTDLIKQLEGRRTPCGRAPRGRGTCRRPRPSAAAPVAGADAPAWRAGPPPGAAPRHRRGHGASRAKRAAHRLSRRSRPKRGAGRRRRRPT